MPASLPELTLARGIRRIDEVQLVLDMRALEVYRRIVPRLGHAQAIGAITHRLCRLIWKILHQGVLYEESGPGVSAEAKKVRARKMIRELRTLGYRVELLPASLSSPA